MNRTENAAIERIDRSRENPQAKARRTGRSIFLRQSARRMVASALEHIEDPAEQAALLGDIIDIAAEKRWPLIGRVETATGLNSVAADVCAHLRLPRAIASASAEQAFAKLTKAANENEGGGK